MPRDLMLGRKERVVQGDGLEGVFDVPSFGLRKWTVYERLLGLGSQVCSRVLCDGRRKMKIARSNV